MNDGCDETWNCDAYTLSSPSFTCQTSRTVVVAAAVDALMSDNSSLPTELVIRRNVPSVVS